MVVFAASASLSILDTWFLALIMIRLAWRTAQTVTDAVAARMCKKKLASFGRRWAYLGVSWALFGDRVEFDIVSA